jgi:catechol 2,3-dioxygenase-like lactoylglutathione lyase family enzyme
MRGLQLSLQNVLVFAPDLEGARDFYEDVLGLQLERRGEDYLSFQGANFRLTVFACERPTQPDNYSQQAGSSIAFAVQSLDAVVARLTEKGVRFLHATPNEGPLGRYVAFVDPFGTVHELVEA